MQRIIVEGSQINLISGVLDLTQEQAAARVGALDDMGDGLYLIKAPVQFKRGETFGYDGEVNKALAEAITPLEVPEAISDIDPIEEVPENIEEAKPAKQIKSAKSLQDSL